MTNLVLKIDPKKAVTSDPDVQLGRSETIYKSAVSARAYELWHERGCPVGSPETDWLRAEEELKKQAEAPTFQRNTKAR
jgi:hypothetical protein